MDIRDTELGVVAQLQQVAHQRQAAGDLQGAATAYGQLLERDPRCAEAWHELGRVVREFRRLHEAIDFMHQAIMLDDRQAAFHSTLGLTYLMAGQVAEATACFAEALRLDPDDPDAHFGQGIIVKGRGHYQEAITSYKKALAARPQFAEALHNLANALRDEGQLLEAVEYYRQALTLDPSFVDAYNNLGLALTRLDRASDAMVAYQKALELAPQHVETLNNLGLLLADQDQLDEAVATFRRALELAPNYAEIHNNLGRTLRDQGDLDGARVSYAAMARLLPHQPFIRLRTAALFPTVFDSQDQMQQYLAALTSEIEQLKPRRRAWHVAELLQIATPPPFSLQFYSGNLRPIKEAYAQLFEGDAPAANPGSRLSDKPRIGMVVSHNHDGVFLRSLKGVLSRLDRRLMVFIFCATSAVLKLRQRIENSSVTVTAFPERMERIPEAIRACRLDLLYYWEVGTDPLNYFLPFFRLAPIQCTSWGIQVTSGIPQLDYYLSSKLVETAGADDHYSERLLRAETLLTYQYRPTLDGPQQTRGELGLPTQAHLYVCAQQPGKLHSDFDPVLAEILRCDERGVLVVTQDVQEHASRALRQRLERIMPDVTSRIVFWPRQERPEYLQLLAAADVLLDPPHFGGVNTTYDALGLDKPIVTLPTAFNRGRYTAACYQKMELTECISSDRQDYIQRALRLGQDSDYRQHVSEQIRQRKDALFEDQGAVTEHERLFKEMIAIGRPCSDDE